MANYARVPMALRDFPQWVNWRYEDRGSKWTKVPYVPGSEALADVTDPSTWGTFDAALSNINKYSGIGFVLTVNDPFFVIDLDATDNQEWLAVQEKIRQEFQTYQEISPSGRGLHIIGTGAVKSGRRRASVEIYSSARYITVTGDVFLDLPITNCQYKLEMLWAEMTKAKDGTVYVADQPQKYEDQEIFDKCSKAYGEQKFHDLFHGRWEDWYPSQSEADYAYIDMVQYFSRNSTQIDRLFRYSALSKRPKANRRDYVEHMINMSFDKSAETMNIETLAERLKQDFIKIDAAIAEELPEEVNGHHIAIPGVNELTLPPGLIGELATYFYQSSYRPMKEAAMVAALGVMAGICGRAYNTATDAGLNLYMMFVARTGMGKEEMSKAVNRLRKALVTPTATPGSICVPSFNDFMGPGEIASNTGLVKRLQEQPSIVSLLGEFGHTLAQISDPIRASQSQKSLFRALLHVYNKSGKSGSLDPMIFAEVAKNTALIQSPAFSLVGEGTPESFFDKIDERLISSGLIPRFIVIEYYGKRPPPNDAGALLPVPHKILVDVSQLVTIAQGLNQRNETIQTILTAEAKELERKFNKDCDNILDNAKGIHAEVWNRAHLNTLKIAGLIAIGVNPHFPTITPEIWVWSENFIRRGITAIMHRFESGAIGQAIHSGDHIMIEKVQEKVTEWLRTPFHKLSGRWKSKPAVREVVEKMHADGIIPYTFIQNSLGAQAPFTTSMLGASRALKNTIQTMIDCGDLIQIPPQELSLRYSTKQIAYRVRVTGEFTT